MNGENKQMAMRKGSLFRIIKKEFLMELQRGFRQRLLLIQWEFFQMS